MIDLNAPLIGPILEAHGLLQALHAKGKLQAALLYGPPGVGKTHLLDKMALDIAGTKHAIEQVNGQSVSVDLVREWRERTAYGNLFSTWTIKRIDEFDCASQPARNEILSLLDYLPPKNLILATTNDYNALRKADNRRLESRIKCIPVAGPSGKDAADFLRRRFKVPAEIAAEIVKGALPDESLGFDGVNMRQAISDAQAWRAAQDIEAA
jgi:chromosomal replication initiation ATPase DnaA